MKEQSANSANQARCRSYLWLVIAAVFLLFSKGKWIIPIAAWLSPVFMLRFIRNKKPVSGFLAGMLVSAIVSYFSWRHLTPIPGVGYVIFIVSIAAIGLLPYLADRLISFRLNSFLSTLTFPLTWTAVEYINSLLSPFGSWGSAAYTQFDNLPLMQIVSITGLWGLSFLIAWFGSVINWAWDKEFNWEKIRYGVGAYALILSLVLLFGGARLTLRPPASDTVRVAAITRTESLASVVKPQLMMRLLRGEAVSKSETESLRTEFTALNDDLLRRSEQEARAGAKIIFWAESNAIVLKEDRAILIERGRTMARREEIYLGMALGELNPGHKPPVENKVVLIEPTGRTAWEYIKSRLVPGLEAEHSLRGDSRIQTLATPYGRTATAICFDMDFPNLIRQAGTSSVDLMFAPSNDWREAAVPHMRMAAFRAIENGFSLVRPTSNGISVAVDYQGRVLGMTDFFVSHDHIMIAQVPTKGKPTIYSRIGDVFAWMCIAGFIAVSGWVLAGKRINN